MTQMIRALALVIMSVLVMNFAPAVQAETAPVVAMDCSGIPTSACDIARDAVTRAPYVGAILPASEPMACARVVGTRAMPVVWVEGNAETYDDPDRARVITDTGIVYTEQFALDPNLVVTESCIPLRLLSGVSELTLCTGQYEDGFHWNLSTNELREMQATGHFQSYVPFLTDAVRDSFPKAMVEAAYRTRYGTRWVMPND